MLPLVLALMLAAQAQTPVPSAPPKVQTPAPSVPPKVQTPAPSPSAAAPPPASAPVRRPAAPTGTATLQVRVTDRSGNPAVDAQVTAEGPASRAGSTDMTGLATLRTLTPGTYRVRAERMGFITLEKEVVVRAGTPTTSDFSLSAAPPIAEPPPPPAPAPAPPPPPPPPAPAPAPKLTPGIPAVVSIANLAEKSLSGRDPVKTVAIGCSGASRAQLIVVRQALEANAHEDTDEMIYLVAGEATLTMAGSKDQALTPSWFSLVPRGTSYKVTQKGRNPAVLLTVVSGEPCLR